MTITELWKNYQSSIVLQLTKTSSSSLSYMTSPPSLRESPVRQISSKDNLGNQVCTPPPKTPLPSTYGFVPKTSSTFQPIASATPSAAPPPAVDTHQTDGQQSLEMSPGSSLPCGQRTPIPERQDLQLSRHTSSLPMGSRKQQFMLLSSISNFHHFRYPSLSLLCELQIEIQVLSSHWLKALIHRETCN